MTKVLFTTTWGPYTEQFFNTSPTDVMNQRFSRGCDIFTLSGHLHMNSCHLIAQNIDPPSVVLEFPRKADFLEEIEKGYDYIGLSFFHNQMDDAVEMCRAIRQKAPNSKIVLGGFGAAGLEATATPERIKEMCDHLCHEEGVSFFRKLLGEQPDKPKFHSHLPKWGTTLPMINRRSKGQTPVVVGSLGCPNRCDFCGTTEYFQHRRIQLMTPEEVHKEFKRIYREDPYTPQVTLLEEDSFGDIEYMRELGKLLREDSEFGLGYYSFYCLASMRSMSQWSFEEMMLTGASTVFVGVESKYAQAHGYGKTEGLSYKEMFKGLRSVGITTSGAWMVGFDFQNRQNIEEDLQDFIALEPTTQQLTRVCPFPATPMWQNMKKEGRIKENVDWNSISFYGGGGMDPKNFNEHEVMKLIERGYRELYETHGATLARFLDVNLRGYEYCLENRHKNKYIGDRGQYHKRMAFTVFPLMKAMEIHAPNNIVRKRMKDLRRNYLRLIGEPTTFQKWQEKGLTGLAGYTKFLDVISPRENIISEESFKKYIYDKPAPTWPEKPYRIERPGGEKTYKRFVKSQDRMNRILRRVESFSKLLDKRKGIEVEDELREAARSLF